MTLIPGTVCCLLLALQWGGVDSAWNFGKIIGLLIGFVVLLLLPSIVQWNAGDRATMPARLLRQRCVLFETISLFFISTSKRVVNLSYSHQFIDLEDLVVA
jgi:hypothetical protein